MAIYDFKCKDCGNDFQIKISPDEYDNIRCPECQGQQLKRIYQRVNQFVKFGKYVGSTGPRNFSSQLGESKMRENAKKLYQELGLRN